MIAIRLRKGIQFGRDFQLEGLDLYSNTAMNYTTVYSHVQQLDKYVHPYCYIAYMV